MAGAPRRAAARQGDDNVCVVDVEPLLSVVKRTNAVPGVSRPPDRSLPDESVVPSR
jgi:hypothetical protein